METGAEFSPCRTWRYALWRTWNDGDRVLAFVGLNPSTADETEDDPTIRPCIGFARREGYDGLVMLNLFAFRATRPPDLKSADDRVGPANEAVLLTWTEGRQVVCCWGNHGCLAERGNAVRRLLVEHGRELVHFGVTQVGQPRHPLYLPSSTPLVPW